jgi:hypothetical protein
MGAWEIIALVWMNPSPWRGCGTLLLGPGRGRSSSLEAGRRRRCAVVSGCRDAEITAGGHGADAEIMREGWGEQINVDC